ncbi:divalent metal cation transporter MntH [bacterium BMS3Abin07]|nr:divalent metal cation transporter MntH [bacterium BMS3Abin07]GBE33155.1 divalent metal cation transporter MntH [bacterium BMS3Bbin05]HDL21175.1 divalent metal cation transporter [Nitrospirota bacterium]HDO22639.1 divalent metal cation transporter [Nitrospirota bacterium]HDZ87643.1 divalent metal cation transporter [Nitrospirota bacterium]
MKRTRSIALVLALLGPGLITAMIDNDASGITTYSVAGARFGYTLLWTLIPTTVALVVVQEMIARMGVVTGKGLSDLIRENFGVVPTFYMMLGLFFANLGTTVANFAGLAASTEMLGLNRYIAVPAGALLIWVLVTKGSYRIIERILLAACVLYFGYIVSGFLAKPDWLEVAKNTFVPTFNTDPEYIMLAIAIIGTTITPWMQFYLQSSIAEKGINIKNYRISKFEIFIGSSITDIISFFIIVTCATTLFAYGIRINEASEAALALKPFAGNYASLMFAVSLANASLLGAIIVPLATAYYTCEAMGWEAGINRTFRDAPQFMWIYTALIVLSVLIILIPGSPLVFLMVLSSFMNGLLLPFVLVFALVLVNNKKIMGEHVNNRFFNIIAWLTVISLIILTLTLVIMLILK